MKNRNDMATDVGITILLTIFVPPMVIWVGYKLFNFYLWFYTVVGVEQKMIVEFLSILSIIFSIVILMGCIGAICEDEKKKEKGDGPE